METALLIFPWFREEAEAHRGATADPDPTTGPCHGLLPSVPCMRLPRWCIWVPPVAWSQPRIPEFQRWKGRMFTISPLHSTSVQKSLTAFFLWEGRRHRWKGRCHGPGSHPSPSHLSPSSPGTSSPIFSLSSMTQLPPRIWDSEATNSWSKSNNDNHGCFLGNAFHYISRGEKTIKKASIIFKNILFRLFLKTVWGIRPCGIYLHSGLESKPHGLGRPRFCFVWFFSLNHFIERWLTYRKLYLFNVYDLASSDISTHLWSRHHNLCH